MYSITGPDGQAQYSWYDSDNRQVANWTYWDDPTTSAEQDKRILTINESDAQGRSIRTLQIIDDNVNGQNPQISSILNSIQTLVDNGTARVLSETQYNSISKVDYALNCIGRTDLTGGYELYGDITLYSYDQTGNTPQIISGSYTKTYTTGNPTPTAFTYTPKTESRTLYDAEGRAVVSVGPYDPAVEGKDCVGTETVYNSLGQVEMTRKWANVAIILEDVIGTGGAVVGKEATGCTSNGAALAVGNELSYSRTEYDSAGRVDKSYSLNELREEICGSEYRYDIAGRQVKTITLPNDTTGKRSETTTQYDGSRRQSVTDGNGQTTAFEYDELGRVTTTIHPAVVVDGSGVDPVVTYSHVGYDGFGRKSWEAVQTIHANTDEDPVLNSEVKYYDYDIAGRLITVKLPAVDDPENSYASTNPLYNYYYDNNGDQVCILDDKGRATVFEYDYMHRLTKKYQPYQTNFTPSATQTRPAYSDTDTDLTNDILSQKPADQLYEQSWYDDYGRLWKAKSYTDKYTIYTYDAKGRLEYERHYIVYNTNIPPERFQKPEIYYTYDNLGRKLSVRMREYLIVYVTGSERLWEYQYNNEGNLATIISPQGTVNYDYDAVTGRKTSTYTGDSLANAQTQVDYSYDQLGRLDSVEAVKRNGLSVSELTQYTYDLNGNRKSTTLPNGVYTEYAYNALNRLTDLIHYQTTAKLTTIGSFSYKMKADGMRTQADEFLTYPSGSQSPLAKYSYDNLNRLTGESNKHNDTDGYTSTYTLDLVGNRMHRTVVAPNGTLDTAYQYYTGTDRLKYESNTGPVASIPYGSNLSIFAYADGKGRLSYQLPGEEGRIGQIGAFIVGLPSQWNNYLLIVLMALIPIVFGWPRLVKFWHQIRRHNPPAERPTLSLYHRCMCVLLAYVFLITPEMFQFLSNAATQYNQISTLSWGKGGETFSYTYDANGSQEYKFYGNVDVVNLTPAQIITANPNMHYDRNEYNLRKQMSKFTKRRIEASVPNDYITEYKYNPDGIRTEAKSYRIVNGDTANPQNLTVTSYLNDPYNHTGYAQVLEESTVNGSSMAKVSYTIGDDILSQTKSNWNWNVVTSTWDLQSTAATEYLLYDGHGSTRQLIRQDLTIVDSYGYDAYGVLLQNSSTQLQQNPGITTQQATNYLYSGEQFDNSSQNYYLRARHYNPQNGLFTQADPYAGNIHDPQSLHKYLYCHNNPVNAIDPTGLFSIVGFALTTLNIVGIVMTVISFAMKGVQIGLNLAQLNSLSEFMVELDRAPVPDLIIKLLLRNLITQLAISILGKTLGLALEIVKDGLNILAFSILLRATLGFLRSIKNAGVVANAAKSNGPITDPSRLLPAPKIHKHHIFPSQFNKFFSKVGIHIDDYAVQIEQTTHLKGVHGKGMGALPGKWNSAWKNFFTNNPSATAKQVFQQAGKMMDEFGLSDLQIGPY